MSLWSETAQALTRAAPVAASEFGDLSKVRFEGSVRVFVKANGGNLTNVTLQAWIWDDEVGAAARCPDLDCSAVAVGVPWVAFNKVVGAHNKGRLMFASAGTTVSAGTTLTVLMQGV